MGGIVQGESQEKILLCKGGHYMKNKNKGGGVFCQLNLISKKRPQFKNVQKNAKNYQTLKKKKFFARFAHSAFYRIHISGAANCHAPVQYAKCVVFFFLFLSSHHDSNPLLHLYHFRKKIYIYI